MIKLLVISILVIASMFPASSQIRKQKDKALWLQADIDFEKGNYPSALKKYESLHELDSANQSILYGMGTCMYILKFDPTKVENKLKKVSTRNYPEVDYYLANIYLRLRKYSLAVNHLENYKNTPSSIRVYSLEEVEGMIRKVLTAEKYEAIGNQSVQIENLGNTINSIFPDYAPLINYQKDKLIYTSRRTTDVFEFKGNYYSSLDKIYECSRTDSGWSNPEPIEAILDYDVHNAATSIAFDGNKIMFYRSSEDNLTGHIFEAEMANGNWSKPQLLGFKVNSEYYTEPSACYSNEEDIIFFASDRPGGYGGKDIYYVKKLPNGTWGEPYNLGPTINTPSNEDGPFLHPITNDLYFSSEGHENMGGYDVFVSSYNDKGEFEKPKNLGYPINSSSDDVFYTVNYDFSEAYVSSDRIGGYGSMDIYKLEFNSNQLPIMVYTLFVQDESSEIVKSVEVLLTDKATNKKLGLFRSNEISGKALIITEPDTEVQMEIRYRKDVVFSSSYIFGENQNIVIPVKIYDL